MLTGAKWIGSKISGCNTWNLNNYRLEYEYLSCDEENVGLVFAARNKDNYLEVLLAKEHISLIFQNENAWKGQVKDGRVSERQVLLQVPIDADALKKRHHIAISVKNFSISISFDGSVIVDNKEILPESLFTEPRTSLLMMVGIKASSAVSFEKIRIFDCDRDICIWSEKEDNFSYLTGGEFNLIDPVTSLYVYKKINVKDYSDSRISKAVLYSSARGFYENYIDGVKALDDFYAPGFTDYRIHIDYQETDVTGILEKALLDKDSFIYSAIVTKGYYTGFCGYSGAENYGRENSYIGKLRLFFEDGTEAEIVTDESFLYTNRCPVIFADYLDGEYYDARLSDLNHRDAHLSKSPFGNSFESGDAVRAIDEPFEVIPTNGEFKKGKAPEFIFIKQDYEGAKIRETLLPVSVIENPKGHFVYDFGQNIVGTVRVCFNAQAGDSFKIRYGEMSYKNGEIYIQNIRNAANTDVYIARGYEDVYVPSFTSHGFRYVEVSGHGQPLESESHIVKIEGLVINNIHKKTGSFECSDELLNKLQKNIEWGQKGNYLLVPTDCPQRNERMGWTGDAQVFAPTAAFNMDVNVFTKKWLRDLREATIMYNMDGAVPDTAPLGGDNRPGPCGGWADAAVIVPYELYMEYGDVDILTDNYDMMRAWVEYQSDETREQEGVQLTNRRGDHLAYDLSTPADFCATAYAARCADLLARIADILGKEADAKRYAHRFEYIRKGFKKKFVKPDGELYTTSQTSYALAIDFGLLDGFLAKEQENLLIKYHVISNLDEKMTNSVKEAFAKSVEERDYHLSVGFLGISHLLPALSKVGLTDYAEKILLNKTEPGWLYSVLNGATTIWERWNSYIAETGTFGDVNMNSFNHYCYGSVGAWIYTNILGIIRMDTGYKEVLLKPLPLCNLSYAKGFHESIYGEIKIEWTKSENVFEVKGYVPDEISATLVMPSGECEKVTGNFYKSEKMIDLTE